MGINSLEYVKTVDKKKESNACLVNETLFGNEECSSFMDQTLIHFNFEQNCRGKTNCFFD